MCRYCVHDYCNRIRILTFFLDKFANQLYTIHNFSSFFNEFSHKFELMTFMKTDNCIKIEHNFFFFGNLNNNHIIYNFQTVLRI